MEKNIRPPLVFFNFLLVLMPGSTKGTFVWTIIMITTKIAHESLIQELRTFHFQSFLDNNQNYLNSYINS